MNDPLRSAVKVKKEAVCGRHLKSASDHQRKMKGPDSLMDKDTTDQLKKMDWFEELPDNMLDALAQKVRKHILSKDQILFNKGDEGDSLFAILSGRVKIFTQDNQGREVALNRVGTGEIIGEMALLDYEPRSASVVALEKTTALELSREDFMGILKRQPDLALSVIRNLSSRLRQNTSYIEQITDMSRQVAKGDYSFIGETRPVQDHEKRSEPDKVAQLVTLNAAPDSDLHYLSFYLPRFLE